MIQGVQAYVPGYTLKNGPVFDGKRVSIYMEVEVWVTSCPVQETSIS